MRPRLRFPVVSHLRQSPNATLPGQQLDYPVEQRQAPEPPALGRFEGHTAGGPCPHDSAGIGLLDHGVPLAQRPSQLDMDVERSSSTGRVGHTAGAQHVGGRNRHEEQVSHSETPADQSVTGIAEFALESRLGSRTDAGQAPRIMQLHRVAVAKHHLVACVEFDGLVPPCRIDPSPERGLKGLVGPVGLAASRTVFGDDGPRLTSAPGRLAGCARSLDGDYHQIELELYEPNSQAGGRHSNHRQAHRRPRPLAVL